MDRTFAITVHHNGSQLPAPRTKAPIVVVTPVTDIYESDREYVIQIDLPGATRETIRVEVVRGSLSVTADVPPWRGGFDQILHREILWDRFTRVFNLGRGVAEGDIAAVVTNGVLTLRVPKTNVTQVREIQVR